MSKIALSGNASGTGTLTLSAPNTDSDRTLTLPDSTGTLATAESTLAQFSASGSAPVYACRAWVNFNGTGTVAIRASGNVSSITDLGLGDYQVNFTTAMPDVDFCITGTAFSARFLVDGNVRTTTSARVLARTDAGGFDDSLQTNVAIFR